MKNVTLWIVKQGIWGKDFPEVIAFATKEGAWEWYENHDNCDKPQHKTMTRERARQLITQSNYVKYLD